MLILFTAGCGSTGIENGDEQTAMLDQGPQQCLAFNRVEEIEIVDDDTLLYFTSRQVYKNSLETTCNGIGDFTDRNAFSYGVFNNVRMRNLCSGEAVGIVNLDSQQNRECELGEFVPVTREEADSLLGK